VRVFVFPGARLLDVIGPIEVFTSANDFGGLYRLQVVSEDGLDVITCAGTRLGAGLSVDDLREPCDVLMIPGGPEWERLIKDAVVDVMRGLNEKARCTAPVCTGAFLLAAAGLLDGHRATTHWGDSRQLALHFPAVQVESDAIFVRDGQMMTSAGVSAGIGLSLALVEEHYGAQVARAVAKDMVVFMQRPGGQSQFSVRYQAPHTRHEMIRQVLDAVVEDLAWLGGRRRHPSLTVAPPAGCGGARPSGEPWQCPARLCEPDRADRPSGRRTGSLDGGLAGAGLVPQAREIARLEHEMEIENPRQIVH